MSGRVQVRYWRAPTRERNMVGLGKGPSLERGVLEVVEGELQGLASSIEARESKSVTYLDWERKRVFVVRCACRPRK